jgi:hypothetical protein
VSRAAALGFTLLVGAGAVAAPPRPHYEGGRVGFDHPDGFKVAQVADAAFELAFALAPLDPAGPRLQLLFDGKKIGESELDSLAAERHAARMKNRVAWGMKADGRPPRESLRVNGHHAVRFRDRVGGALGASEQIMTCVVAFGHLACVVSSGAAELRDRLQADAELMLSSLTVRRR